MNVSVSKTLFEPDKDYRRAFILEEIDHAEDKREARGGLARDAVDSNFAAPDEAFVRAVQPVAFDRKIS